MRAVVKKWGNSASVRIPASLLAEAGLSLDQTVDIRSDNGAIIIEPIKSLEYDLDELISAITPENMHEEVDFGEPVGKEAL
ncbi:antitoxin MazE [Ancylobacter aquaticus]|uniref:Antitoxin MazE n=1 Tax=Ancylobacter aquaticus TaxID=100 RepID=A0A4R1HCR2_ANCAQ|nr:AbrB/MazE/SpoVT family DNA-binding domain-containing protein [Ancylobacter aquaticus]TCK19817.1 antitoxin MazE [Ancylobacter aquaticus]